MAQYRFSASIVSRGNGSSVVAKAAYNAREVIRDERTGEMKDYSRATGVEFSGIFAPKNAPEWVKDRAQLWNAVEAREDRSTRPDQAQLARNIELSLPHELNAEQRRQLVRDFVREQFVRKGMIADVAIHAPSRDGDERNYHVHILITLREIGPQGFGKKVREWNNKELNSQWREKWAELGARYLEQAGHQLEAERYKVGHLTLEKQREAAIKRGDREYAEALDREATKHLGPHVSAMEKKGIETDLGDAHRDILQRNKDRSTLHALKRDLAKLERQDAFENLKRELTEAEKVLAQTQQREIRNTGRAAAAQERREPQREAPSKLPPPKTQSGDAVIPPAANKKKTRVRTGPRRGGLVPQQMWIMQRLREAERQRQHAQERRERDYSEKQKRDSAELDPERYRMDPEYRRQMQNTQAYKSPEEKKRDRENEVRAIMERQDRGR